MKKFSSIIIGSVILVAALALNFRHVLDDYGIVKNKLHVEVLAQTNGSGGSTDDEGGSTDDGGDSSGGNKPFACTAERTVYVNGQPVVISCSATCESGYTAKCSVGENSGPTCGCYTSK